MNKTEHMYRRMLYEGKLPVSIGIDSPNTSFKYNIIKHLAYSNGYPVTPEFLEGVCWFDAGNAPMQCFCYSPKARES